MFLVKPSHEILPVIENPLQRIEAAGRICYKSEDKITADSAERFVKVIKKHGHLSVIEHATMTVRFICDRGVTHELVRHRLASYSQESTRYCNYGKEKFGRQITVVIPPWLPDLKRMEFTGQAPNFRDNFPSGSPSNAALCWLLAMIGAERTYLSLLNDHGWSPQQARSVLPNSLKTEIVMTANFREWGHVFKLRCAKSAHPQMRELMMPLEKECTERWPALFGEEA